MALYQRGGVWWADVYHEGTRVRRSTGETDRRKAKAVHDALAAESHRRPRGRHTLKDAVGLWEQDRERSGRALSLAKLLLEYHGDCDLSDVSAETVRQGLGQMVAGSHNRYLSILKRSLKLAQRSGWIRDVPEMIAKKGATQRTEWLSRDEWVHLRAELSPQHLAMADFAMATGLRLGTIRLLEWKHVTSLALAIPGEIMKAGKPLTVPLSQAAQAVLSAQRGKHQSIVFPGRQGDIMGDFTRTFSRAATRAGVPWATFHTLRHTWASWHVMNGTPLEVLQKLGGWATYGMVLRYAHLAPSYVASWVENATQQSVTDDENASAA